MPASHFLSKDPSCRNAPGASSQTAHSCEPSDKMAGSWNREIARSRAGKSHFPDKNFRTGLDVGCSIRTSAAWWSRSPNEHRSPFPSSCFFPIGAGTFSRFQVLSFIPSLFGEQPIWLRPFLSSERETMAWSSLTSASGPSLFIICQGEPPLERERKVQLCFRGWPSTPHEAGST